MTPTTALASSGAARGRSAEDAGTVDSYRLTMPMLRKLLPTMYAPGAKRCETSRQAGVQPREAAIIYAALLKVLLEHNDPEIRKFIETGGQS